MVAGVVDRCFGGSARLIAAAVLLLAWELLAAAYFNANVTPEFRVGAITGADPTVPAEMRVVQTRLPFPSLVLLTLFDPANAGQLWGAGLITLRSAVLGFAIGGLVGFGLALADGSGARRRAEPAAVRDRLADDPGHRARPDLLQRPPRREPRAGADRRLRHVLPRSPSTRCAACAASIRTRWP